MQQQVPSPNKYYCQKRKSSFLSSQIYKSKKIYGLRYMKRKRQRNMLNDTRMQSAKCGMQGQITHFLQRIHCKEKKGVNLCKLRDKEM